MLKIHPEMVQGSDEWYKARCGLLTASEMRHIITPAKLQYATNEKTRDHLDELAAQRVTKFVEPTFFSAHMERGQNDESYARGYYADNIAPVMQVGFVTNDKWGFTLGYSPDGLVDLDGLIECKSRLQKFQFRLILGGKIPSEHILQMQAGMLIAERAWCDYVSFCGGMHMKVIRVHADEVMQKALIDAAASFHEDLNAAIKEYELRIVDPDARLIPTERHSDMEIYA